MGGGRRIWRGEGVEIRVVGKANGAEGIVKGEGRHGHSRRAEEYSENILGETKFICRHRHDQVGVGATGRRSRHNSACADIGISVETFARTYASSLMSSVQ